MGKHRDDPNGHKKIDPKKIAKPKDPGGKHSAGGDKGGKGGKGGK